MPWEASLAPVRTLDCTGGVVPAHVFDSGEPLRLAGLLGAWPAVAACGKSAVAAAGYLSRFWIDVPVTAYVGDAAINGRFFYDGGFTGFNFKSGKAPLAHILQKLAEPDRDGRLATIYVGSTPVDKWLPGFRRDNDVRLPVDDALASFWLGSETRISAHYDFPDNLACVVAGERRITLFPPDQVGNLYVGPIDRTPSGQPISLVDMAKPDFERHPKFGEAIEHGQRTRLFPGDALFIPSMWWHYVESLAPFNLLVNYWWSATPAVMGAPSEALLHAILSLRDLPPRQREVWRGLFNHYVFDADESVYEHIPESGRGCLAKLDDASARRLRADLLAKLNR